MYATLPVVFAILGVATCLQTYPLCSDVTGTGTLNDVVIEGCTVGQPCVIAPGMSKDLTIDFTPSKGSNGLTVNIYAYILGIWIPYPGFDTQGCSAERNIQCPLVANTKYEYQNKFTVPSEIPKLPTFPVRFQFVDDSSTVVCFLVDVSIQK